MKEDIKEYIEFMALKYIILFLMNALFSITFVSLINMLTKYNLEIDIYYLTVIPLFLLLVMLFLEKEKEY